MCMCEYMAHIYGCPERSEEDLRSPGAGTTGRESPGMSAETLNPQEEQQII